MSGIRECRMQNAECRIETGCIARAAARAARRDNKLTQPKVYGKRPKGRPDFELEDEQSELGYDPVLQWHIRWRFIRSRHNKSQRSHK